MRTEASLWLSISHLLRGAPRLRWFRLALAGWHFYVDAVSLVHDHIWDGTSLLLRKGIRRYTWHGQRVLDMGTGHVGLLAIFCTRFHQVEMVAVDVNENFVENARRVAFASECPNIDFRQSDWFCDVNGTFDVIVCNCPYVPTEIGATGSASAEHPEIWDGGQDGLTHIRKILSDAGRFLNPDGLLLLGVDTFYVPRSATLGILERSPELELRKIVRSWISTSEIYVIGLKRDPTSVC
jgi:methylase of polypeptide subunit release factors